MRVAAFEARVARDLLAYLRDLEAGRPPMVAETGLCDNLVAYLRWLGYKEAYPHQQILARALSLLEDLMTWWPEHSGSFVYPVPSYQPAVGSREAYGRARDLWSTDTAYGQARWRLVAWLRQELEEALPLLDVLEEV